MAYEACETTSVKIGYKQNYNSIAIHDNSWLINKNNSFDCNTYWHLFPGHGKVPMQKVVPPLFPSEVAQAILTAAEVWKSCDFI